MAALRRCASLLLAPRGLLSHTLANACRPQIRPQLSQLYARWQPLVLPVSMQRSLSTATSQAAVQPEATKPKQQHTRNKAKVPYKGGQNKKKAPRRPLHDPNDALYTKCSIRMESFNYAVLDSYVLFLQRAAHEFGVQCSGRVALPTHKHKFTVLKSPHVYKKHRAQFDLKTHKRLIQLRDITHSQLDTYLRYVQNNVPAGVSARVSLEEAVALPTS